MRMKSIYLCLGVAVSAALGLQACTPEGSAPQSNPAEVFATYKGKPVTKKQIDQIIREMTPYTGEQAARDAVEGLIVRN